DLQLMQQPSGRLYRAERKGVERVGRKRSPVRRLGEQCGGRQDDAADDFRFHGFIINRLPSLAPRDELECCPMKALAAGIGHFVRDIRFSARGLAKNPGFAAITVASLALGIGGSTAMYSVIYGVILNPFAYHDVDRLVSVG